MRRAFEFRTTGMRSLLDILTSAEDNLVAELCAAPALNLSCVGHVSAVLVRRGMTLKALQRRG